MKDFLLDDNLDLRIANGDFVIGESDRQHQRLLLVTDKGMWKENPATGVGVDRYLESEDPGLLLREIRLQFSKDGMTVNNTSITDAGVLVINAAYK